MLKVYVVDQTAEARSRLIENLRNLVTGTPSELEYLPRLDFRPVALPELKYSDVPDMVVLGPQYVENDPGTISAIRKTYEKVPLLIALTDRLDSISKVDEFLRRGADDIVNLEMASKDFTRRIMALSRKAPQNHNGKLVLVDSGKGGMGVTTLTAMIGDLLQRNGKEVCLVDLDSETQDLSRFLQSRPHINGALQDLLDGKRPVTEEFVKQALVKVWEGKKDLWLMPPPADGEGLNDPARNHSRIILSIFEYLDSSFDYVVVDAGSLRGPALRTLYRIADTVCYALDNDPASAYASIDQIEDRIHQLSPTATLLLVENRSSKAGLPSSLLRAQIDEILIEPRLIWAGEPIPNCPQGGRWAASGESFYGLASRQVKAACCTVSSRILGIVEESAARRFNLSYQIERIVTTFSRLGLSRFKLGKHEPLKLPEPATVRALPQPSLKKSVEDEPVNGLDLDLSKFVSEPIILFNQK